MTLNSEALAKIKHTSTSDSDIKETGSMEIRAFSDIWVAKFSFPMKVW